MLQETAPPSLLINMRGERRVSFIKKGKVVTSYLSNMKYLEGYEKYTIMRNPVKGTTKGNHTCKELSPS